MLSTAPVLKLCGVNAPVTISTDVSSKSLGSVLLKEGQPVANATQSLMASEKNYPQIEKETLAGNLLVINFMTIILINFLYKFSKRINFPFLLVFFNLFFFNMSICKRSHLCVPIYNIPIIHFYYYL